VIAYSINLKTKTMIRRVIALSVGREPGDAENLVAVR